VKSRKNQRTKHRCLVLMLVLVACEQRPKVSPATPAAYSVRVLDLGQFVVNRYVDHIGFNEGSDVRLLVNSITESKIDFQVSGAEHGDALVSRLIFLKEPNGTIVFQPDLVFYHHNEASGSKFENLTISSANAILSSDRWQSGSVSCFFSIVGGGSNRTCCAQGEVTIKG
jgi:hypothetical protein